MSETATLKVGDDAPDAELPSRPTGDKFKLSDARGKNPVVINFVPAAFSPACSNQLPLIEQKTAEFASQGAVPVVISSDGAWTQAAWKKELGVSMDILSDFIPLGATAKAYGVAIEPRMVANRVVVVVDEHGKVAGIQPAAKITDMPDYDPVMACSKD